MFFLAVTMYFWTGTDYYSLNHSLKIMYSYKKDILVHIISLLIKKIFDLFLTTIIDNLLFIRTYSCSFLLDTCRQKRKNRFLTDSSLDFGTQRCSVGGPETEKRLVMQSMIQMMFNFIQLNCASDN